MSVLTVTSLTQLTFPDITGATIRAFGQVNLVSGTYVTGGVPFGLVQFADARTIDFNGFLKCDVWEEEAVATLYTYNYVPSSDKLQIFLSGVELANGTQFTVNDPAQAPDQPVGASVPSGNQILFEATWDRTTVRG